MLDPYGKVATRYYHMPENKTDKWKVPSAWKHGLQTPCSHLCQRTDGTPYRSGCLQPTAERVEAELTRFAGRASSIAL